MVNIAILGLGTIGYGVYDIIKNKYNDIIKVKKIFDKDFSKNKIVGGIITDNLDEILNDKDITICVETLGGLNFAYNCDTLIIKAGKSLVTANKEVVATYFNEMMKLKEEYNVSFSFEASCGGAVPIIKNMIDIASTDTVTKIEGIINGTTNFILTKLSEGLSFEEAMELAIKLGFAERDSSYDFDGLDMLRKIAILTNIASKKVIDINDIYHYSLKNVALEDINFCKDLGFTIKYIASNCDDYVSVEPRLVNDMFSLVNNEYNLISVDSTYYDNLKFYGKGAGRYPTACAIVNDIVDIVKNNKNYTHECVKNLVKFEVKEDKLEYKWYARVKDISLISLDKVSENEGNKYMFNEMNRTEFIDSVGGLDNVIFYAKSK